MWLLALLLLSATITHATLLFETTPDFAAIQVKLTTTSGFISENSANTFTIANPGNTSINSLGLALCGYDFGITSKVQFRAQASYDEGSNMLVVIVLPSNGTSFYFINYYLLVTTQSSAAYFSIQNVCLAPTVDLSNAGYYNRSYVYNLTTPLLGNSSSGLVGLPFLRSLNSIAMFGNYNFYNVTALSVSSTTLAQVTVMISYSAAYEVCLSVLYYDKAVGLSYNSFLNTSYGRNLRVVSSLTDYSLPTVSSSNFSMPSIYGPTYSPKCVVGLSGFLWSTLARQTLSFNTTGAGIYDISSSSSYNFSYNYMCVTQILCSSTLQQYYPLINQCEAKCSIENCQTCSTSTSCLTCNNGYYINTLYRCSACIANCKTCASATTCSACFDTFYYNSYTVQCLQCPLYCLVCSNNYCTSCQTGYIPSGAQCLKCSTIIFQCESCSSAAYCSSCAAGTYFVNIYQGCVNCNSSIAGCATCGSAYICYTCQWGYYLLSSRCYSCVITVASCCPYFVANCVTCRDITTCSACQVGYFLDAGKCTNCSLQLSNCTSCANSSTCLACQDNYYLNGGVCTSCSSIITPCLTCTNLTYCQVCASPYLAVEGSCYLCPQWPLNGLYFLDSSNVCHGCDAVTASCTRCTSATLCTQCKDLFYLSSTASVCISCGAAMPNCLSCKSGSSCSICTNGYYPSVANASTCLLCNASITYCLSCRMIYYRVTDSNVLGCSVCQPEYYINDTVCSSCSEAIDFCLACQNSYQCTLCNQGYFLSSVLTCVSCSEVMPGCTNCTSGSLCAQCTSGYYLINNYCTLCSMTVNNCYQCQYTNAVLSCSSCTTGYFLARDYTCSACNTTLSLCTACKNSYWCVACIAGYTPDGNGVCSPCGDVVPYCEYCTPELTCRKCKVNYILDSLGDCQSCSYYLQGCLSCSYATTATTNVTLLNCSGCDAGYLIYTTDSSFYKCVACNVTIPYCSTCLNTTNCKTCSNVSFLNQEQKCSLCYIYMDGCQYCSVGSQCTQCMDGYYLSAGKCLICDSTQFGTTSPMNQSICLSCSYVGITATCTVCLQAYYLSSGNCSLCGAVIQNCYSCTSAVLCTQCLDGYYLSTYSTSCVQCDPALLYCVSCNSLKVCLGCRADCYLNSGSNSCVFCSTIDANCQTCSYGGGQPVCSGCKDGYYLEGGTCKKCSEAMSGCVVCSSATTCLLTSASPTTASSSTIFIVLTLLCFLIILAIVIYLLCKRKSGQEEELPRKGEVSSQTQRELISDQLMKSDGSDDKTVKLTRQQKCHYCNRAKFQSMNVELLCHECADKINRGDEHKINKEKVRKSQKETEMLRESSGTEDHAEFQPRPSQLQPSEVLTEQKKGVEKENGLLKKEMGNASIERDNNLIKHPAETQSLVQPPHSVHHSSQKGISITSSKHQPK